MQSLGQNPRSNSWGDPWRHRIGKPLWESILALLETLTETGMASGGWEWPQGYGNALRGTGMPSGGREWPQEVDTQLMPTSTPHLPLQGRKDRARGIKFLLILGITPISRSMGSSRNWDNPDASGWSRASQICAEPPLPRPPCRTLGMNLLSERILCSVTRSASIPGAPAGERDLSRAGEGGGLC